MGRFIVVTWHGESKSIFYLIDSETEDIWDSFRNKHEADHWCKMFNNYGKRNVSNSTINR